MAEDAFPKDDRVPSVAIVVVVLLTEVLIGLAGILGILRYRDLH
jgi:hypothetical protein